MSSSGDIRHHHDLLNTEGKVLPFIDRVIESITWVFHFIKGIVDCRFKGRYGFGYQINEDYKIIKLRNDHIEILQVKIV